MTVRSKSSRQIRLELAHAAARLVAVDGVNDYLVAKRKAAERLGVSNRQQLPSNQEIEQALTDYQRLFQGESQPQLLRELRGIALEAMQMLRDFRPRLAGAVADGTAGRQSEISLHLYADTMEEVAIQLIDSAIPYESCERRVRINAATVNIYPAYRFLASGHPVVLVIFPFRDRNQSPLSPIDGRAMQRLGLADLRRLLDADASPPRR